MRIRALAVLAVALCMPLAMSACGDDSTGDLSESEISKQFQEGGVPKETADCMAGAVKDADLTEDELKEFTDDPTGDTKAGDVLKTAMTDCIAGG